MTRTPCVQPVEPVAGNPHGGFCEGGQAQAASTASPVPTHQSVPGFQAAPEETASWLDQSMG